LRAGTGALKSYILFALSTKKSSIWSFFFRILGNVVGA
jgi:hypothetical protein